jgi:3-deoxy-D-manno-octulosonic-acid transferase
MTWLFDLAYLAALALGWPLLIYRRLTRGPGSLALGERLGNVPSRSVSARCVWIHGVSLGEINATRTLVAELRRRAPDVAIVVSSTTQTGLARARQLYPRLTVFRFPLDLSFIVRRVLSRVRPSIIVLMELEVWPNLIYIAARRGVPVVIANGRVTDERTMRRFQRPLLRSVARGMFRRVRWVGAQEEGYARRFALLGVPPGHIELTGSLKYDAADVGDRIDGQDELAAQMTIDPQRPLWVCGSTGPGEEAIILDAYQRLIERFADLQLAIIPRKPERFDEVAQLIAQRGFACLRRSGAPPLVPHEVADPRPVFLGDTMGELRKFYALAAVVFVGRTLVPLGGSDVMEVAGLGKPLVVGPHTDNFAEAVELLRRDDACRIVADGAMLAEQVELILADAQLARRVGDAARAAILSRRGATERTIDRILELAGS